jgi:hypothetical protein
MRKHRISDADAATLLKGQVPVGRPDLAPLAEAVTEFRTAAYSAPLAPSAELAARLDLARASGISVTAASASDAVTVGAPGLATSGAASRKRKVKHMFSWFIGLGLAAKIALGTVVAAAAVTGAGVAGVLPGDVQEAFDTVVTVVDPAVDPGVDPAVDPSADPTTDPTAEPSAEPTEDANVFDPESESFGEWVSERAHNKDKNGHDFGQETSQVAQHKNDGTDGQDAADTTQVDDGDQGSATDGDSNGGNGGNGSDHNDGGNSGGGHNR